MRILVVASFNKGRFAPFIIEQAEALKRASCEVEFLGVQGKGLKGYLDNIPLLRQRIRLFDPDVIHAHYGLSGLFANLQRRVPVVTTYHGSDINDKKVLPFSKMSMLLSAWNIFVSKKTLEIAKPKKRYTLLPCGIDLSDLQLTERIEARQRMALELDRRYVLFAGAFDNTVKNAPLAKEAVVLLHDEKVELLELKGYSREEVTLLMCGADAFLMTSISEGSPQVVKEALACGCPIVSVNVGDVEERTKDVLGCFVSKTREPNELALLLQKAMAIDKRILGREKLVLDKLDNEVVTRQLVGIFERVVKDATIRR